MNKQEKTVDLQMNGGLNCTQAILTVYGEALGIDPDTAKLFGRPFGGGIGGLGKTCGYITGAVIALGYGRNTMDEQRSRMETNKAIKELFRRFEERYGTTRCKKLLGADMSTPEGAKKIKDQGLVKKNCPGFARKAAEILNDLL